MGVKLASLAMGMTAYKCAVHRYNLVQMEHWSIDDAGCATKSLTVTDFRQKDPLPVG